jgi:hypothetical protein
MAPDLALRGKADEHVLVDGYGFGIDGRYAQLYCIFEPVWEREEDVRIAQWQHYLLDHAANESSEGSFPSLASLAQQYLQDALVLQDDERDTVHVHGRGEVLKFEQLVRPPRRATRMGFWGAWHTGFAAQWATSLVCGTAGLRLLHDGAAGLAS